MGWSPWIGSGRAKLFQTSLFLLNAVEMNINASIDVIHYTFDVSLYEASTLNLTS